MEVKWTKNLPLMIMGYGIIIIGIGGRINYHFSVQNSMILLIMCSILTIGLVNTYKVSINNESIQVYNIIGKNPCIYMENIYKIEVENKQWQL